MAEARKLGRLETVEGRQYRRGRKPGAFLPADVVDAAGGLLNRQGNPRLWIYAAARAAVLQRCAGECESDALETATGRIIHRRAGTFIKSAQGFAEDARRELYCRMKARTESGDPLDDDDFHRFYRRFQKQQERHDGELLENTGPAYGSGRKRVRDAYGRRWRLSGRLREVDTPPAEPPDLIQTTGGPAIVHGPLRSEQGDAVDVLGCMAEAVARSDELFTEFSHAVTASHVEGERRTAAAVRLMQRTAREGRERPGFVSVGSFRPSEIERKHERTEGRPCAMPWIVADLDATDPETGERSRARAFELAGRLVNRIEAKGGDPDAVLVVDTGGRGAHVLIPAGMVGNVISPSEHTAERRLRTFWKRLCGDDRALLRAVDFTLCRPSALRRLPGTLHESTGRRAVAVTGEELRDFGPGYVYELTTAGTYSPGTIPDPTRAPFARRLAALLYRPPVQPSLPLRTHPTPAAEPHTPLRNDSLTVRHSILEPAGKALPTATVRRLREPISEGESWGESVGWPRAVGRHFAANQLARHLFAVQPRWDRERVERAVQEWNRSNAPPLPRSQVRAAVRSAWKYVRGHRRGPP